MPLRLPSPSGQDDNARKSLLNPSWRQPRISTSSIRRHSWSQNGVVNYRDNLMNTVEKVHRRVLATIEKMSVVQRILAAIALLMAGVLGILFLVFNEKIFHALEPFALKWKKLNGGWTILWAMTFITAFPPMVGYSMCCTLSGFVYGLLEGWFIIMTASVVGSFCSFIVSRTVLRNYVERMVASDKRFAAFALTLKHDGLKLLCMIRLCPLPYSISNGAMSTFPTVDPFMYAAATAIVSPKLLIHAFVGNRLAAIARTGEKMTMKDRAVNWLSIVIGVSAGLFTGWFIYRKTMARVRELEAAEAQNARTSASSAGIMSDQFSDDPEAHLPAEALSHDDEDDDIAYFDDQSSPHSTLSSSQSKQQDFFTDDDGVEDAINLQDQRR